MASLDSTHGAHWATSIFIMVMCCVLYGYAAYYWIRLYKLKHKHNQMVVSFLHLIIPDIVLLYADTTVVHPNHNISV